MTDQPTTSTAEQAFKGRFSIFEAPFSDEEDRFYVMDAERWKVSWQLTRDKAQWLCDRLNPPTIAAPVDWTEKERAALDWLMADRQLSERAVIRQALAHYQDICVKINAGETCRWSGDAQRARDFAGDLATPTQAPDGVDDLTLTEIIAREAEDV